jgi:hypothetical protein
LHSFAVGLERVAVDADVSKFVYAQRALVIKTRIFLNEV